MTRIYNYDEDGYFTDEAEAPKCVISGENVFPSRSTVVKPAIPMFGYTMRFSENANSWTMCKRRTVLLESQGGFLVKDLKYYKDVALYECKEFVDKSIRQGFEFEGLVFDIDPEAFSNIHAQVLTMLENDSVVWYSSDNQCYEFKTKSQFLEFVKTLKEYISSLWAKNAIVKNEINSINDFEKMKNYIIDYDSINLNDVSLLAINIGGE